MCWPVCKDIYLKMMYSSHLFALSTEYKYSDYRFIWHKNLGSTKFRNSKLGEVAKVLEGKASPGAARIRLIKHLLGMENLMLQVAEEQPFLQPSIHVRTA